MEPSVKKESKKINIDFYEAVSQGQLDYWRKMAAPRFRVKTLLKEIQKIQPSSLVDLGCGGGQLLAEVQQRFPRIKLCGVDLSQTQIELNKKNNPSVDWITMDLDHHQAPNDIQKDFDGVLATEIIEHVDHPKTFLENAYQLAQPKGGKLFLSTQSGQMGETERRVGHHRHFTADEMRTILKETGWEPLRVWNAGYPFHDWSKLVANLNPGKMMDDFGDKPYGFMQNAICFFLRLAFKFNSNTKGVQLFALAERKF